MKKYLPLFIVVAFIFTACPGVYLNVHRHSIARIKEKYACNVEIVNNSSSTLQYRYAPLKTRKDYESLPYIPNLNKVMEKIKTDGLFFSMRMLIVLMYLGLLIIKSRHFCIPVLMVVYFP